LQGNEEILVYTVCGRNVTQRF